MAKLRSFVAALSGFRKFAIMFLLIIVGIIFRIFNLLTGAEFVDLLSATAVAFMSANGIEHMTKAVTDWVKGKASG